MNQDIKRLNSSVLCYEMLQHPPLKEIMLKKIKSLAGEYGFNFPHYEKTGVWMKEEEVEKKEYNIESKITKCKCKGCDTDFDKRKNNQKFCNEICKNRFHNSKRN